MRPIHRIVIHHTASGNDWDAARIDKEHRARGWSGIGYHYVILQDGTVQAGRAIEKAGAHAKGANGDSIGVVLVGSFEAPNPEPAPMQWLSALDFVLALCKRHGIGLDQVYGHNEVGTTATLCPGFSPRAFRDALERHAGQYA